MLANELDATLGRSAADSVLRSGGRILLLGDDLVTLQQLERILVEAGFGPVTLSNDMRRALVLFADVEPDVLVLDLDLSGADPSRVIRQVGARVPDAEFLPIVVIASEPNALQQQHLLDLGVCDVIDRRTGLSDITLRLQNALRLRDLTAAIEQRVAVRTERLHDTELELASRLAAVAELCDYGDASHVQRVGRTSALLAAQLGIDPAEVELIRHAAPLHDIGKVAIPEAILLKSDPLTLEEWDIQKTHTAIGARLLSGSISPILQIAEKIALYHHEHWDGTGYTGVSGDDIPLVARIVIVADVFDSLTHDRPYKSAWSPVDSVDWMQTMSGQRFDPRVLDALVEVTTLTDLTELGDAAPAPLRRGVTVATAQKPITGTQTDRYSSSPGDPRRR